MSFEGMVRALEALAGTPASAASLERRHVRASAVRDCAHVQPRPVFELGELSESPESVASSVGVGTGRKSPTQLPAPDSVGIVNADHLMKQFRTCMSDLLEERMETVLDSIARIREEVSAVSNSFNGLELRLNILERRLEKTVTGPLEQAIRSQGEEIRRVAASTDVTCSRVRKLEECLAGTQPACTSPSPRVHPRPAQAVGACQAQMHPHSYSRAAAAPATDGFRAKAAQAAPDRTNAGSVTEPALQATVTSCYQRPARKHDRLRGASRLRCKAVYVGRVDVGCSAGSIAKWCEDRSVTVIKCSVSAARYFGLAYAHLVISEEHWQKVQSLDFWPSGISVREWRFKSDRITQEN